MSFRSLKRKFIFKAGDIRRECCLGGFAWGRYPRLIDYEEAFAAQSFSGFGYIGLHRNRGDLSNVAISGFMKHAWIHTGPYQDMIIEAVSEGVLYRHSLHGLMSDYAVILKPKVADYAMTDAVERASFMVGCPYDDQFKFDLEIVDELFQDKETALDNMKTYGLGVSCTEMAALCYVGHRRELGLYRTKAGSRQVILPDNFLTTHFEIVWASKHTTLDNALKLGLHEEGCTMLGGYWKRKTFDGPPSSEGRRVEMEDGSKRKEITNV
jgi:hypothetical protein